MAKPMEAKKLMLSLVSNCCRNDICLARENKQKKKRDARRLEKAPLSGRRLRCAIFLQLEANQLV
jgi:hypothetical protein